MESLIQETKEKNKTAIICLARNFTVIPESIETLSNLRKLDMWKCNLTSVPETIGNLNNLEHLILSCNSINHLPETFGCSGTFASLRFLYLNNNDLTCIPEKFGESPFALPNLKVLYLGDNKITWLPDGIGNLRNISTLDITNNLLTYLPETLKKLINLKYLQISGNGGLVSFSPDYCQKTIDDIIECCDKNKPPHRIMIRSKRKREWERTKLLYVPHYTFEQGSILSYIPLEIVGRIERYVLT